LFSFLKLKPSGKAVLDPDFYQDRIVLPNPGPYSLVDFVMETKSVFEFPAPGIGPAVREGREELAQQIGVSPVDLDRIHPGFPGPAGGLTEGPDDFQDFFLTHGPTRLLEIRIILDDGRCQGLSAT
jgi:hypothetical protein